MADQIFPGFEVRNAATYFPVFGNWCGPSWSAGQRVNGPLTSNQLAVGGMLVTGRDGVQRESLVDLACKAHDIGYSGAIGQVNQGYLTLQADVTLLQTVATLAQGPTRLSTSETTYAAAMAVAFVAKLSSVDVLGLAGDGVSALKQSARDAVQQILNMASPFGNKYSDASGNSVQWAYDGVNISIKSSQAAQTETFTLTADGVRTFDFKTATYDEKQVANPAGAITAYISGTGDIANLSNQTIVIADGSTVQVTGSGNAISAGSNTNITVQNDSEDMKSFRPNPPVHVPNTLVATGFGDQIMLTGHGQTDVTATNASITVVNNYYDDLISGSNTVTLSAGAIKVPDGATVNNIYGNGWVNASYGTFDPGSNANIKLTGANESTIGVDSTNTIEYSGPALTFSGTGGTFIADPFSVGTFTNPFNSNPFNIYANYSNVGIFADTSNIFSNTNYLTDLNIFGSGNSLFGTNYGSSLDLFGNNNTSYWSSSNTTIWGTTTGDLFGTGSIFSSITTPDYSFPSWGPTDISFDDPVVLNLTGGVIRTQNLVGSTAYFDVQNNGKKVHTGWGIAGEGYLVYDPANTNTVVNDQDLVASFAAMKALDKNGDNVLNSLDACWSKMKVWVDSNGTATFVAGSLKTMDQMGIASINLNATRTNRADNNNKILDESTFTWKTGGTGNIAGVDFNFHASSVITPTPPRSGGGGGCVEIGSFLPDSSTAGSIKVGSAMILADERSLSPGAGVVSYSQEKTASGFRIRTAGGATLVCSDSAPIPTKEGLVLAPELLNKMVAVRKDEGGSSLVGWETVTSVESIGLIQVQHITVGDKCFWAGEKPGLFILHHNLKMIP